MERGFEVESVRSAQKSEGNGSNDGRSKTPSPYHNIAKDLYLNASAGLDLSSDLSADLGGLQVSNYFTWFRSEKMT